MSADRLSARTLALIVCVGTILLTVVHFSRISVGWISTDVNVTYSDDNSEIAAWTPTLTLRDTTVAWYARLEISPSGYSRARHVLVIWQLQQKTGMSAWTDVSEATFSTSALLSGDVQNIYATHDGAFSASNNNWRSNVARAGTYRVIVTVEST